MSFETSRNFGESSAPHIASHAASHARIESNIMQSQIIKSAQNATQSAQTTPQINPQADQQKNPQTNPQASQNLPKSESPKSPLEQLATTLKSELAKSHLSIDEMHKLLEQNNAQELDLGIGLDVALELIKAQGLPLETDGAHYFLSTARVPLSEQRFCFVDIETTGAKPKECQVIEIGAITYQNGEIIGRFEEFIHAPHVPEMISEITGITSEMLKDSRRAESVLRDFKEFLGDSVFVAHNVGFDYGFLSYALDSHGFGALLNPRLCTINLARKSILSRRYSLQYLNEFLGINTPIAHRAYADALTSLKVFEIALKCAPSHIRTAQDLIDFSTGALKR
ncbi:MULTISPECIES: 3'-5' exonuclease [unclassified Helicobacter]|uniref:3'-5' exonuclease n=1 Tax=unclassified Helicobacter TaxID=2593540 RepID=UPI000B0CB5EB|nr:MULTISPECIES: 3'-5' exonuclease [unclassified Helicobacter]